MSIKKNECGKYPLLFPARAVNMRYSDFWRSDATACADHPNHLYLYNRLDLLADQNLSAWPLPMEPERYPVTVDFIMSLDEDETSITIHDTIEWNQTIRANGSAGRFWTEQSNAPVHLVDTIVNRGTLRCHDTFTVESSRSGLPLQYTHAPGYSLPLAVLQFIENHLAEYVGPVSLKIQEDVVVDLRLRWSKLNCIWLQQIDFLKIAPAYACGMRPLRPLAKPLLYIPCWVDDDNQDVRLEASRLAERKTGLPLYETDASKWSECCGYTRIGVFAINPRDLSRVQSIKVQQGLT